MKSFRVEIKHKARYNGTPNSHVYAEYPHCEILRGSDPPSIILNFWQSDGLYGCGLRPLLERYMLNSIKRSVR